MRSPELGEVDPYISDDEIGKWVKAPKRWVYEVDIVQALNAFASGSRTKAVKASEQLGNAHRQFWEDKKQHGLEDIGDRFKRFTGK